MAVTPAPVKVTTKYLPNGLNHSTASRKKEAIKGVVLHWIVGTLAGADAWFRNKKAGASAHVLIGPNEIRQIVRNKDIAWHAGLWAPTSSRPRANTNTLGYELEGKPGSPPNSKTRRNAAWRLAKDAYDHGWPSLKLAKSGTVTRHGDIVATQCPGTTDVADIIRQANALLKAWRAGEPAPRPTISRGATGEHVKTVQRAVNNLRKQDAITLSKALNVDGVWGPKTDTGVALLQKWGGVDDDRVVGPNTWPVVDAALAYVKPAEPAPVLPVPPAPEQNVPVEPEPPGEPEPLPEDPGLPEERPEKPWWVHLIDTNEQLRAALIDLIRALWQRLRGGSS